MKNTSHTSQASHSQVLCNSKGLKGFYGCLENHCGNGLLHVFQFLALRFRYYGNTLKKLMILLVIFWLNNAFLWEKPEFYAFRKFTNFRHKWTWGPPRAVDCSFNQHRSHFDWLLPWCAFSTIIVQKLRFPECLRTVNHDCNNWPTALRCVCIKRGELRSKHSKNRSETAINKILGYLGCVF